MSIFKQSFSFSIQVYDSASELAVSDRFLLEKAQKISENAHSPYSKFQVGAAILLENGEIVCGNNQENAAYPSGLCAERTAIFWCSANYPDQRILKIAIAAKPKNSSDFVSVTPCGSCRQSMLEYEVKQLSDIELIMQSEHGKIYVIPSVASLLPLQFCAKNLITENI